MLDEGVLNTKQRKKLGLRASAYVEEHGFIVRGRILVADLYETPEGVVRTLTRVFGRPQTFDRGEVAYWTIEPDR